MSSTVKDYLTVQISAVETDIWKALCIKNGVFYTYGFPCVQILRNS